MRGIFFYGMAIAFASGIFLRSFFDVGSYFLMCLLLVAVALIVLWMRNDTYCTHDPLLSPFFILALILVSVSLGVLRLDSSERQVSSLSSVVGDEVTFSGTIIREPDERDTTTHLYIAIDGTDERVLVIADGYRSFIYGDRIRVRGELTEPESFETELGRTFDYPGYLRARGVTYTLPFPDVEQIGTGAGNPVRATLFDVKRRFTALIEQVMPEPQVGLSEGLLLGMKRALGEDLEDAFRRTGIIHIIVLSGYNVMLVAEGVMRLLSIFFSLRTRVVIGVVGISTFALLVGLSATVVRASIMASLILIARATGRTYAILRALVLAGLIMLLINPYLIAFDPGFQLSFLATLGLIFLAPLIEARLHLVPSTYQVREFVTATVSTQIFVSPLLLYLMGTISVVAVIVNVLVLPAVPVAMLMTVLTGLVGFVSVGAATLIGFFTHIVLSYIITVAEVFSRLSFAELAVAQFPFWVTVLGYLVLGLIIRWLSIKKPVTVPTAAPKRIPDELIVYAEWTIEEETKKPSSSLPFR